MAIQSIAIRDFRALGDCRLRPAPKLTLVVGPNGAGKTSLLEAIRWGLLGLCEWTDGRGAGSGRQVSHEADISTIDIGGDFGAVMRTIARTGDNKVAFNNRSGREAEAALATALPDKALLNAMLRSDGFLGLDTKAQTDLLFRLSGGAADADWFRVHLTKDEQVALKDNLATRLTGQALVADLDKAARDKRAAAKKRRDELQAKLDSAVAAIPQDGSEVVVPTPDAITKLEADLAKAAKRHHDALQESGRAQGLIQARQAAVARCERARENLTRANEALRMHGDRPGAPKVSAAVLLPKVQDAERMRDAAASVVSELQAQLKVWRDNPLPDLGAGWTCPLLQGVPCGLTAEQWQAVEAKRAADVTEHEQARQAALQACDQRAADLRVVKSAHEAAVEAERAIAEWERKLSYLQQSAEDASKENSDAAEAYQKAAAPDPEALRLKLASAKEAAEKAQAALDAAKAIGQALASAEQIRADLKVAQATVDVLEGLVAKLAPKGLPAKAMQETVGKVIGAVNEVLGKFCRFSLDLRDDGLWCDTGTGYAIPTCDLSESEQMRVGIAISVAIAKLTGFGTVLVDAADRLDSEGRSALLTMLYRSGVQAIVAAVPLSSERPSAPGLDVYDIVDGVLVPCEVNAEQGRAA